MALNWNQRVALKKRGANGMDSKWWDKDWKNRESKIRSARHAAAYKTQPTNQPTNQPNNQPTFTLLFYGSTKEHPLNGH